MSQVKILIHYQLKFQIVALHMVKPEVILHDTTGFLVAEKSVDAVGDVISTLLKDPERAALMGRAGRERVEKYFTLNATAKRLRNIMEL